MSKWHNSKEYKIWRKNIIERDKCCVICGSDKDLEAHHINHGSYFPEQRFKMDNGVLLCSDHHKIFHTSFKRSYRQKCTFQDFKQFIELIIRMQAHGDCQLKINKKTLQTLNLL